MEEQFDVGFHYALGSREWSAVLVDGNELSISVGLFYREENGEISYVLHMGFNAKRPIQGWPREVTFHPYLVFNNQQNDHRRLVCEDLNFEATIIEEERDSFTLRLNTGQELEFRVIRPIVSIPQIFN